MAVAGGDGIALGFAVDGGSVAVELGRDGAGRGSLLVQSVDLAALVVLQLSIGLRSGDFSHMIVQPGHLPPYLVSHLLLQLADCLQSFGEVDIPCHDEHFHIDKKRQRHDHGISTPNRLA